MNRKKLAARDPLQERKHQKALMGDFVLEDVHLYRLNRHSFTVYLGGDPYAETEEYGVEPGVEHNMADRFEMNLGVLSGINQTRPILVEMASCGGNWDEGMQIFSAILTCPNPITVLAVKWARSMTSLIPLAADRFLIRPPGQYMFHHGTWGYGGLAGEEADTNYEELKSSRDMMLRLYVARLREQGQFTSWSERRIRTMLEEKMRAKIDVWLSADDAVKWGFADSVFSGDRKNLRATKRNQERRQRMMEVVRAPYTKTF